MKNKDISMHAKITFICACLIFTPIICKQLLDYYQFRAVDEGSYNSFLVIKDELSKLVSEGFSEKEVLNIMHDKYSIYYTFMKRGEGFGDEFVILNMPYDQKRNIGCHILYSSGNISWFTSVRLFERLVFVKSCCKQV